MPLIKKVNRAVKLIQSAGKIADDHGQPLEICYSGGKDSDVLLQLARISGVNYRAIYKNTTIDPPGTIKHAREQGVEVIQPKMTFQQILEKKGLPSRTRRHCCDILKEYKVLDYAVIGVRHDESKTRAKYEEPTICRKYKKRECTELYMPLLDFTTEDIETFIKQEGIKCHPLYYDTEGNFHVERRLGCIGCPLAYYKHRIQEFKQYPKMAQLYVRGAQKFLDEHPQSDILKHLRNGAEWLVFTLFCKSYDEWEERFGSHNLFNEEIDCHKYLAELFGITI